MSILPEIIINRMILFVSHPVADLINDGLETVNELDVVKKRDYTLVYRLWQWMARTGTWWK